MFHLRGDRSPFSIIRSLSRFFLRLGSTGTRHGPARGLRVDAGANITCTAALNRDGDEVVLTIAAAGGSSYTDEEAQDAVGTILADSTTINFTYTDATPEITAIVIDGSIGTAKLGGDITAAGIALLDDADAAAQRTTLGLGTADSPQFTAINLGHATDTTLARSGAGDVTIEGNAIYRAGGTDVPVADGGSGRSTATAYAVICGGTTSTGAHQSISSVGTLGHVLTSNGAGALPTFQAASASVPDGDKGDLTISLGIWTIDNDVVSNAKLRNSAAVSVIGRSANSTGDPADIAASANDRVLRRVSDALDFGQLTVGMIPDALITYAKIQNVTASRLLGRGSAAGAGAPVEIAIGTGLEFTGGTTLINSYTAPPAAATQAELEAASITTAYSSPGRQQFHPSAAKFWVMFDGTAGSPTAAVSYNVTSITKHGTGDFTVTIATDFSSANWCALIMSGLPQNEITSLAAGTIRFKTQDSSGVNTDTAIVCVAGFGDQ